MTRLLALLALPALLFACNDSDPAPVDAAKGAEESPLTDFEADSKADSWRAPTAHGQLLPGTSASARLHADALFHAWTMTLTDAATIDLAIASADANLDTVAYLYRQDPETGNWGRYLVKNDDSNGTVFSHITHDAKAGSYRLMVKGFKKALRGNFAVTYTCEGAGCPSANPVEPTIETGPYSAECGDQIRDIVLSEVQGDGYNYVAVKDIDTLPPLQRAAAQWFIDSALEWADESDLEDMDLEIGSTDMAGGSRVDITTGADWSYSYLFDIDGRLRIQYFHDQSPYAEFFCPEGETAVDEPDEYCAGGMIDNLPHSADAIKAVSESEVTDETAHFVAMGTAAYTRDTGAAEGLTWTMNAWSSESYGGGAQMTFEAEGQPTIRYWMGGDNYDGLIYFSEKSGALTTRCAALEDLQ